MTDGTDAETEPQSPQDSVSEPSASTPVPAPQSPEPDVYKTSGLRVGLMFAAIVALGLYLSWSLTVVILGVVVMITVHELGHFLTAKWAGMKVTEFFIGFGPKLWSFTRGETEYGFKAIPAGAYVRIIGMHNLDEVAPEDEARSYRQQSFPKRLTVVLAGPATHFIQALIIVFVLLAVTGLPGGSITEPAWVVGEVTSDSAAGEAGLEAGDRILTFDGKSVPTWEDMQDAIRSTEVGDEVTLTVERDGERLETTTEMGRRPRDLAEPDAGAGTAFLGVGPSWPEERLGVLDAVAKTPGQTADITWMAVGALGNFFSPTGLGNFADTVSEGTGDSTGSAPSSSSGSEESDGGDEGRLLSIVGAVRLGAELGEENTANLLAFFLQINIFVGMINLVPLLPFDGGHASVAIYERIRSRRGRRYHADVAKLLPVAYAVVMGLVVLGVTTLYLDLVNPVEF